MADASSTPIIVWFRQDLRLADNPALAEAARTGRPVLPVYVLDDDTPGTWRMGGAARWWLHHSLAALGRDLAALGCALVLRRGDPRAVLPALIREAGADTVFWNRRYEPFAIARDEAVKASLKAVGFTVRSFNAALLHEPWTVTTRAGGPCRVHSAFWRACLAKGDPPPPLPAPRKLLGAALPGDTLDAWRLLPDAPDWAGGLRAAWTPGEAGARQRLTDFLDGALEGYAARRDQPGLEATSRLSPHLRFGEVGPRQVWHAVLTASGVRGGRGGAAKFLAELGRREFSYHLLYHHRGLPAVPLRPEFADFPWREDPEALRAWQRGATGYPLVDAGMRELWSTGWMHNRVRMIAASFLVKHLLIPWQTGEAWFWDTLVDADLASNAANWQWIAGCGADAAPYFRIFNPVLQGMKFDPEGDYVRRWVPELRGLPARHVHRPWEAPEGELRAAGVVLGRTYPTPVVDHAAARGRALAAFARVKKGCAADAV
ncbi:deoxyribodipyrimidine photo-lyase [Arenibaculum sp.]|uniref:cryptochrome/photolyase family protein n=1 Tax=Arenibaculum sp. TaxID=2865862 RepID=UPI002E122A4E|nr:deoxyribodipyrimidine photo-lyase [Arenibaculum sp.]